MIDDPVIERGLLSDPECDYLVLANHSEEMKEGCVETHQKANEVVLLDPGGEKSVIMEAAGWSYCLDGFSGVVFKITKKANK